MKNEVSSKKRGGESPPSKKKTKKGDASPHMFGSADPSRVRTQRIQLPPQWTPQEGIVESPP